MKYVQLAVILAGMIGVPAVLLWLHVHFRWKKYGNMAGPPFDVKGLQLRLGNFLGTERSGEYQVDPRTEARGIIVFLQRFNGPGANIVREYCVQTIQAAWPTLPLATDVKADPDEFCRRVGAIGDVCREAEEKNTALKTVA